ncbi:MAG: hypothetical protein ACRDOJ_00520, partial [Nocardioidaceae bacterium]
PAVRPAVLTDETVPIITGEPVVDLTLTASPGVWTPTPTSLTYQWTADDTPIAGATTPTLTLGPELVGRTLSVTVTASRNGYPDDASTSDPTAPVAPGTFTADPPTVTGTPHPGETLRIDPGEVTPAGAIVSVRWLRAGVPVPGAAGSTYPLTTSDLGARVTARVRLTKPGYTTLTRRAQPTRRVKALPRLRVRTEPGQRRLHLTVGLTASGVSPVPGTVAVRSRGRLLRTLTLRGGTAAATLRDLQQGLRPFTVRYRGSEKVSASTVSRTVRIG